MFECTFSGHLICCRGSAWKPSLWRSVPSTGEIKMADSGFMATRMRFTHLTTHRNTARAAPYCSLPNYTTTYLVILLYVCPTLHICLQRKLFWETTGWTCRRGQNFCIIITLLLVCQCPACCTSTDQWILLKENLQSWPRSRPTLIVLHRFIYIYGTCTCWRSSLRLLKLCTHM